MEGYLRKRAHAWKGTSRSENGTSQWTEQEEQHRRDHKHGENLM